MGLAVSDGTRDPDAGQDARLERRPARLTEDGAVASLVVDHLRGSRRGARQVFAPGTRVRFGRHPACEVAFHPRRDLDASSRHAELVPAGASYVLRDVGSSNGTFVDGRACAEVPVPAGAPIEVGFGPGGPLVRIYLGAVDQAPPRPGGGLRRLWTAPDGQPRTWLAWLALALGLAAAVAWVSLV